MTSVVSSSRAPAFFILLCFLLGVVACWTRDTADLPLSLDNQHYFFIAERAAAGVPPHVSHFDPKHALSLLMTAASIHGGRFIGLDDVRASRIISVIMAGTAVAAVWALCYQISSGYLCAHLGALVILHFGQFFNMAAMGSRPKVFIVAFMLLTVLAVARNRPFWAGVTGAAAFLCWQPTLLVLGMAVPILLLRQGRVKSIALLAAGALIPIVLYHFYFYANGALAEQIEQAYRYPREYMAHAYGRFGKLRRNTGWYFRVQEGFSLRSVYPILFGCFLAITWLVALVKPRRTLQLIEENPALPYVVLAGTGALAFTIYDYQGYPDTFFVLPFLAVVCGVGFGKAAEWLAADRSRFVRLGVFGLCLLAVYSMSAITGRTRGGASRLESQYALGRQVGEMLEAGKTVYAVGCTHLLAFNHVDNHVNMGFFFRGTKRWIAKNRNSPDGYRPLKDGEMPDVILVSRSFVPGGYGWLESEYREITTESFRRWRVRAYERI